MQEPRHKSTIGKRVEIYGPAYRLAWKQVSPAERRERPDIPLRIHASIRRQLKDGVIDPSVIASVALEEINEWLA